MKGELTRIGGTRFTWFEPEAGSAASIVDDFDAALPEFWDRFDHAALVIRQARLPFYSDYSLVVIAEGSGNGPVAAALYAPGDVRPLGPPGTDPITAVNLVAPLRLTAGNIADYLVFVLLFGPDRSWMPLEDAAQLGDQELTPSARAAIRPLVVTATVRDGRSLFSVTGTAVRGRVIHVFGATLDTSGVLVEPATPVDRTTWGLDEEPWRPQLAPLIRIRPALGVTRWRVPTNDELCSLLEGLDASGELSGAIDIVRRAEALDFYEPYRLYEVLQRDGVDSFRKAYVFCHQHNGKVVVLNGTSPPIHSINIELGDERSGRLLPDAVTAAQYLRFFCWAVHGDEGPFYLIGRSREIPWRSPPHGEDEVLAFIDARPRLADLGFENGYYAYRGTVLYGNAIFGAEFRVDWAGTVEMLTDEPLLADLPVAPFATAEGGQIAHIPVVDIPEQRVRRTGGFRLPDDGHRLQWNVVTGSVRDDLLHDCDAWLPEFWAYVDHGALEARLAQLPFYSAFVLASLTDRSGRGRLLALWAPGNVIPLDGTAKPLQLTNQLETPTLNIDTVSLYVWFYLSWCARSPHPCLPVESPEALREAVRGHVASDAAPLNVSTVDDSFEVSGALHHGDALLAFTSVVHADGEVTVKTHGAPRATLTVERQIVAARNPGWPFTRFTPVSHRLTWTVVTDAEEARSLDDALRAAGVVGENEVIVRQALGSVWLSPFGLFEVLERPPGEPMRRGHLLFDVSRSQLRVVTGTTAAADALLAELRERRSSQWLQTVADAAAYLDFWLWSRHLESDSRRVIRRVDELGWWRLDARLRREVEDLLARSSQSAPPVTEGWPFRIVTCLGSRCFLQLMTVAPDGGVRVENVDAQVVGRVLDAGTQSRLRTEGGFTSGLLVRDGPPSYLDADVGQAGGQRLLLRAASLAGMIESLAREQPTEVVEVSDRDIPGAVSIAGVVQRRVVFRRVRFADAVRIEGCPNGGSLEFHHCRFEGDVVASGASISRDLIFSRCRFAAASNIVALHCEGADIGGNLVLRASHVSGGVFATNLHVHGAVRMVGLRVMRGSRPLSEQMFDDMGSWTLASVTAMRERYERRVGGSALLGIAIRLTGARIDRELEVGGMCFEPLAGAYPDRGRRPRMTVLAGALTAEGAEIGGDLTLTGLVVIGDVHLTGTHVRGYVSLDSFQVSRAVEREGSRALPVAVRPAVIRTFVSGKLWLDGVDFKSGCGLGASYIGQGISLASGRIDGVLTAEHQQIGTLGATDRVPRLHLGAGIDRYSLLLSGATCSAIELSAPICEGMVTAQTGTFGRLFLDCLGVKVIEEPLGDTPMLRLVPPSAMAVILHSVTVKDTIRLDTMRLSDIGVSKLEGGPKSSQGGYYARPEHAGSIIIRQCEVGANVVIGVNGSYALAYTRLGHAGYHATSRMFEVHHAAEDAKYPTDIAGELDLRGTIIKGELDLSNLTVGERIRFGDLRVSGDIIASRYAAEPWPRETRHTQIFRTRCAAVDADQLQCDGDVDFTGLDVRRPPDDGRVARRRHAWSGEPDVNARGMRIGGQLLLSPADGDGRGHAERGANVEGRFLMPTSSADRLIASGANFLTRPAMTEEGLVASAETPETRGARLDVERSTFRRFEILLPLPDSVDLTHVTVDRWELEPVAAQTGGYVDLLSRSTPFKTGTYASIERALRQQGDTARADEVYKAMRRRWTADRVARHGAQARTSWAEGRRLQAVVSILKREFRRGESWIDGRLLGYGTTPAPLLILVFALMLPSLGVFHDQRNIVAKDPSAEAVRLAGSAVAVHPVEAGRPWRWDDAVIMTVRYHVPFFGSVVDSRFEPTSEPIELPRWMYSSVSPVRPISGHLWAGIMSWTSGLLWSLLLLVIARAVRIRMVGGA